MLSMGCDDVIRTDTSSDIDSVDLNDVITINTASFATIVGRGDFTLVDNGFTISSVFYDVIVADISLHLIVHQFGVPFLFICLYCLFPVAIVRRRRLRELIGARRA
jgi:hypothetical protein